MEKDRRFLVHIVQQIAESNQKLTELKKEGFVIIGVETPRQLELPLDYTIQHEYDNPACIVALGFKHLNKKNCCVIFKPDLDAFMAVAILYKVSRRWPFTEKELMKIELIARYDSGDRIEDEELEIIRSLHQATQNVKFFERWNVVLKWLRDESILKATSTGKASRQILVEYHQDVVVLISLGIGALARRYLRISKYAILLNPLHQFMKKSGRRYIIYSTEDLSLICDQLNQKDKVGGWGGHDKIVGSSMIEPSALELQEVIDAIKSCGGSI
jgi:hypothetical protein